MQTGQVYKLEKSWAYRYRAPNGRRPQNAGFATKGEARAALNEVLRRLSLSRSYRPDPPTLSALVDEYLEQHIAEDITIATLRYRLQHAVDAFGSTRIDRMSVFAIGAWRKQLPAGSAHYIHRALRQVLRYGVRCKYIDENPAAVVPNPAPRRGEMKIFSWNRARACRRGASTAPSGDPDLRRRHRSEARGVDRARAARCRPA